MLTVDEADHIELFAVVGEIGVGEGSRLAAHRHLPRRAVVVGAGDIETPVDSLRGVGSQEPVHGVAFHDDNLAVQSAYGNDDACVNHGQGVPQAVLRRALLEGFGHGLEVLGLLVPHVDVHLVVVAFAILGLVRHDRLAAGQDAQVWGSACGRGAVVVVDAAVALRTCGTDVEVAFPIVVERRADGGRQEVAYAAPAVVLDGYGDGLSVAEQGGNGHAVAVAAAEGDALGCAPGQASVEAAAERYLLFARGSVGALVGEVELKLAGRQFQHGGFPTTVLEGVVRIVDKYLVAPGLAVVGAAAQAYAEVPLRGIGRGGAWVVGYDDGAVGELYEVGHAVGHAGRVGGNDGGRGPRSAFVRREADLDAAAFAAGQQPMVLQLNEPGIAAAAEDGDGGACIPVDATACVAADGGGSHAEAEACKQGEQEGVFHREVFMRWVFPSAERWMTMP